MTALAARTAERVNGVGINSILGALEPGHLRRRKRRWRAAIPTAGSTAMSTLDLAYPHLDWLKIANRHGVEAARATTLDHCRDLMTASFAPPSPFLTELVIKCGRRNHGRSN